MSDNFTTTAKFYSIWTPAFALLCLTQLLGYAHNALLTPMIPLYVTHLGGSAFVVGLVLAAFNVTGILLRPLVGSLVDTRSEAGVLAWGCFLLGASMLLFFIPVVETTMLANGLRGIGWAGLNIGGYALLALSAPVTRRGEASGYYVGAQAGVGILFPALALWLVDAPLGGFWAVIVLSAAIAVTGGIIGLVLGRYAPCGVGNQPSGSPSAARLNPFALVEREVLLPSAVFFFLSLTDPAVTSFLVLYTRTIGIENVGWYFVVSGVISLLARFTLGRVADRIGWGRSLAAAFILEALAVLLLAVTSGLTLVLVSGILYSLGNAIGVATSLALAIQRANPQRRGRAMASYSTAYPLSAGIGALLAGGAVEIAGYFWMYLMAAALVAAGLLVTLTNWSSLEGD